MSDDLKMMTQNRRKIKSLFNRRKIKSLVNRCCKEDELMTAKMDKESELYVATISGDLHQFKTIFNTDPECDILSWLSPYSKHISSCCSQT